MNEPEREIVLGLQEGRDQVGWKRRLVEKMRKRYVCLRSVENPNIQGSFYRDGSDSDRKDGGLRFKDPFSLTGSLFAGIGPVEPKRTEGRCLLLEESFLSHPSVGVSSRTQKLVLRRREEREQTLRGF